MTTGARKLGGGNAGGGGILKAQGLEYEAHGRGDAVLLIHGAHVAGAFLTLYLIQMRDPSAVATPIADLPAQNPIH